MARSPRTRNANGEGSIRQRPDGTWEARLTVDGKRLSHYAKTRQEVSSWLVKTRRARDQGLPPDVSERMTLGTYLSDWLERTAPSLRPSTARRYRELVVHLSRYLGKIPLARLSPAQIDRAYAAMRREPRGGNSHAANEPLSSSTVHHAHAVLHRALADAVYSGVLGRNAADLVRAPALAPYEAQIWTIEQTRTFLRIAVQDRYGPFFIVAACTGLRNGELRALRWQDVDLSTGVLTVRAALDRNRVPGAPKTRAGRRRVDLPRLAISALQAQRARQNELRLAAGEQWHDEGWVFASRIGTALFEGSVGRALHELCDAAALPRIRVHDLRHLQATLLLAAGINTKAVSERLGHSTVNLTLGTYAHVLPTLQREAAEVLDRLLGDWDSLAESQ